MLKRCFVYIVAFNWRWHIRVIYPVQVHLNDVKNLNYRLNLFNGLYLSTLGREFMDLLLSPASKVLNNWFEVVIIILISFHFVL